MDVLAEIRSRSPHTLTGGPPRARGGRVDRVFLFPSHTVDGAYEMPEAEIEAVRRVIRLRVGG